MSEYIDGEIHLDEADFLNGKDKNSFFSNGKLHYSKCSLTVSDLKELKLLFVDKAGKRKIEPVTEVRACNAEKRNLPPHTTSVFSGGGPVFMVE